MKEEFKKLNKELRKIYAETFKNEEVPNIVLDEASVDSIIKLNLSEDNMDKVKLYFLLYRTDLFDKLLLSCKDKSMKFINNMGFNVLDILPERTLKKEFIINNFYRDNIIYKKIGRDKNGYDFKWTDKDSKIVEYFKVYGEKVENKKQYLIIAKKFAISNLSVEEFCSKYGIDNINGFRKMLRKLGMESAIYKNENKEYMDLFKEKSKESLDNKIKAINNGELSFEQYYNNYYSSFDNLNYIVSSLNDEAKKYFLLQMVSFILKNEQNLQIEKFNTLLNNYESLEKELFFIVYDNLPLETRKRRFDNIKKMRDIINKYKEVYSDKKRPLSFIDKNGNEYKVTDEIFNEVIKYLNDNDISICSSTVSYYLRKKISDKVLNEENLSVKKLKKQ